MKDKKETDLYVANLNVQMAKQLMVLEEEIRTLKEENERLKNLLKMP